MRQTMNKSLSAHEKDRTIMNYLFEEHEIGEIKNRIKNLAVSTVVYCSFESRFAKSGGLAAVTIKILPYLKEVNKIPSVILMTPFHSNIIDDSRLKSTGCIFDVPFGSGMVKVQILEYTSTYNNPAKGSIKEFYLKARGFFNARNRINDPYIYFENDISKNDNAIAENALLFCKAVPIALQQLKLQKNIVFHLQDWQTALISLTSKLAMLNGTLLSCATVQTMHNSFDSFIAWESLAKIIDKKRIQKLSAQFQDGLTAYQIGLQLIDAPITTVSENFAKEFTTDILQTKHFAPHLQQVFKTKGVVGINNGLFIDFPAEFSNQDSLTIEKINSIKSTNRKKLLKVLTEYNPPQRFGDLTYKGDSITSLPDAIPIFVMSGRLDFNQKGFDIFLQSIERFARDEIKVILTPMPVKLSHLDFVRDVVNKCNGNVTLFPIKMVQGFHELQIGSTYGVMPSIYEPFGAAIEYMVNGTVNIARQTGGLVDQIEDHKCGFLYRENEVFYNRENINNFFSCKDNLKLRRTNKWVQSMVASLYETLLEAINLYNNHRDEYYRLINRGFNKARSFDWSISARKYFAVYEKAKHGIWI